MDDVAFTIRVPRSLVEQIDARKKIHRRSRNAEINIMLEQFIDRSVGRDLEVLSRSDFDREAGA